MSDRKPCCQEAWEEGWLAGLKTAGEMLAAEPLTTWVAGVSDE